MPVTQRNKGVLSWDLEKYGLLSSPHFTNFMSTLLKRSGLHPWDLKEIPPLYVQNAVREILRELKRAAKENRPQWAVYVVPQAHYVAPIAKFAMMSIPFIFNTDACLLSSHTISLWEAEDENGPEVADMFNGSYRPPLEEMHTYGCMIVYELEKGRFNQHEAIARKMIQYRNQKQLATVFILYPPATPENTTFSLQAAVRKYYTDLLGHYVADLIGTLAPLISFSVDEKHTPLGAKHTEVII